MVAEPFRHPIYRSRRLNLYGHIQYDHKDLDDRIDLYSSITKKELHTGTFALSANAVDGLLGGGLNQMTLSLIMGNLDIRSIDIRNIDAITTQINGSYAKGMAAASRLQKIIGELALYISFNGQIASQNLDSSEKFSLGGIYGVRSYPVNEASGDNAFFVTGELRYGLTGFFERINPGDIQLIAFTDAGSSWINKDSWAGAGTSNRRDLSGAGVGLNWSMSHFTLRTSYAWALGSEKATSDVDRGGVFWIQAVAWF